MKDKAGLTLICLRQPASEADRARRARDWAAIAGLAEVWAIDPDARPPGPGQRAMALEMGEGLAEAVRCAIGASQAPYWLLDAGGPPVAPRWAAQRAALEGDSRCRACGGQWDAVDEAGVFAGHSRLPESPVAVAWNAALGLEFAAWEGLSGRRWAALPETQGRDLSAWMVESWRAEAIAGRVVNLPLVVGRRRTPPSRPNGASPRAPALDNLILDVHKVWREVAEAGDWTSHERAELCQLMAQELLRRAEATAEHSDVASRATAQAYVSKPVYSLAQAIQHPQKIVSFFTRLLESKRRSETQ